MKERAWMVRAGSFVSSDYEIHGVNLMEAVKSCFPRILKDVASSAKPEDVLVLDLRWYQKILNGGGGAELLLKLRYGDGVITMVAWISSTRAETPDCVVWQRRGTEMALVAQVDKTEPRRWKVSA